MVANVTDTLIAARQGAPPIIELVMPRMSGDEALQNGERFAVQLQSVREQANVAIQAADPVQLVGQLGAKVCDLGVLCVFVHELPLQLESPGEIAHDLERLALLDVNAAERGDAARAH